MGLPAPNRFARVDVARESARIRLEFSGAGGTLTRDIDLALAGPGEDPEALELRLLARLQELGYDVHRAPPPAPDDTG